MSRTIRLASAAAVLLLWPLAPGAQDKQTRAEKFMVAAANPLAVEAGYEILREGGSAVDAMIAVQTVLNLVEPQSSGLGGGAFLIYYDAARDQVIAYNGREPAPSHLR